MSVVFCKPRNERRNGGHRHRAGQMEGMGLGLALLLMDKSPEASGTGNNAGHSETRLLGGDTSGPNPPTGNDKLGLS